MDPPPSSSSPSAYSLPPSSSNMSDFQRDFEFLTRPSGHYPDNDSYSPQLRQELSALMDTDQDFMAINPAATILHPDPMAPPHSSFSFTQPPPHPHFPSATQMPMMTSPSPFYQAPQNQPTSPPPHKPAPQFNYSSSSSQAHPSSSSQAHPPILRPPSPPRAPVVANWGNQNDGTILLTSDAAKRIVGWNGMYGHTNWPTIIRKAGRGFYLFMASKKGPDRALDGELFTILQRTIHAHVNEVRRNGGVVNLPYLPPHCREGILSIMRSNLKHDREKDRATCMGSIMAAKLRVNDQHMPQMPFPLDATLGYPEDPTPIEAGYIRADVKNRVDQPFLNLAQKFNGQIFLGPFPNMITFAMAGIALTTRERGEGDNTPIWREWESLGEIAAYFYPYVCSLFRCCLECFRTGTYRLLRYDNHYRTDFQAFRDFFQQLVDDGNEIFAAHRKETFTLYFKPGLFNGNHVPMPLFEVEV